MMIGQKIELMGLASRMEAESEVQNKQVLIEKNIINSNTDERSNQKLIRNVCILAHVDHGKTTLADQLIASYGGGVLHPKQAGTTRFMDYLDEERRRHITMKSSSIGLLFKEHSINLIDSPGHMDFCSEVSTAARLSDGALIVVDAVEGVQVQTRAVLRQAWIEKLTPCLVLNKVDQLICKLEYSPMQAYEKLKTIIDEVNGIVSGYKSDQYISDVDSALSTDQSSGNNSEEDGEVTFQPQKGNVVFASAIHGWGFTISDFAEFHAPKLNSTAAKLQRALWGPLCFNPMTKRVKSISNSGTEKPMFVQFILKPIWEVYETIFAKPRDDGLLQKVVKGLNLSIPSRELQNKEAKAVLQSVMSRWLPLSDTILSMAVKCIPDPVSAQSFRISRLLPRTDCLLNDNNSEALAEAELVRKSVEACDSSSNAPCVAFVSKLFAVPTKLLPCGEIVNGFSDDGDSEECFLAFARIFSGVLVAGQRIFVLSARHDPLKAELKRDQVHEAEVQALYLMMGQGLKPVDSAKAGNIIAIKGIDRHILKSATLSSTISCWPFSSMTFQVSPIVKKAVEPSNPADMAAFEKGLQLLNRADPFVKVITSARGEHIIAAAGEVHLERCLNDLKERFAKVSLEVSPPLVSFKETIVDEAIYCLDTLKLFEIGDYVERKTPNGRCVVRVKVMKLPDSLTKLLDESSELLKDILGGESGQASRGSVVGNEDPIESLKKRMMEAIENDLSPVVSEIEKDGVIASWKRFFKRIWALGPWQVGPNILFTPGMGKSTKGSVLVSGRPYVSEKLGFQELRDDDDTSATGSSSLTDEMLREAEGLGSSVLSGFQLSTSAGPLCDEPMWGLAFSIEAHVLVNNDKTSTQQPDQYGILTGQVMTAVKEACRAAVHQMKPRIVEPWYFCELNTPAKNLGSMPAILSGRRGYITENEMQGGSSVFTVHAYLPVSESFGFAEELSGRTSGACSASLVFHGDWRTLHEDPFFVPKSEDETEVSGVPRNKARKLIDSVRRHKGLPVEEKVVPHATKQRTLARKV